MTIDPRIDPRMPHQALVQQVADIIRDHGPLSHKAICERLPPLKGLTSSYTSYVLKRLRAAGVAYFVKKKKSNPLDGWVYIPGKGETGYIEPTVKPVKGAKVMLRNMGSYRVIATDGQKYDRMEFHRADMTWSNRVITLGIDDIAQVAFVPDHVAYKSGVRHLDLYAHPFVSIDDCVLPKPRAGDEDLPKWINPIRARMLNAAMPPDRPKRPVEPIKKDFGDPFI